MAAKKDGTILYAHCTYMADLGEACSHVVALLFCAEANTQARNNASTTSGANQWIWPTIQRVECASIADINLKKRRRVEPTSTCSTHAAYRWFSHAECNKQPNRRGIIRILQQSFTKWH